MYSSSAFGRIAGQVVRHYHNDLTDPGTYALIGAASLLGGVSRQTISNAVILLEVTDDLTYAIPIMAATFAGKFVGDMFGKSLYQSYVDMLDISYMSEHKTFLTLLRASDIMESDPVTIHEVAALVLVRNQSRVVENAMFVRTHNAFCLLG